MNKLTEANLQQFYHQLKHGGRLNRMDLYSPGLSDCSVRGCHITCRAALALQWGDLDLGTGELRISRQAYRVRGKLTETDAAVRTIVLSPAVTEQLRHYRKQVDSRWIFPSPKKEDAPRDPAAVRKLLSRVLKRAQCPKVRFHDLRHTFVTTALEYGMDVKTLSAVVGHQSSSTTLNVYTHVTKAMERQAAAKID